MKYRFDEIRQVDNKLILLGWAIGEDINSVLDYKVLDANKKEIESDIEKIKRQDVVKRFSCLNENLYCGFEISFEFFENQKYYFRIIEKNKIKDIKIDKKSIDFRKSKFYKRALVIKSIFKKKNIDKAFLYLKENGFKAFLKKIYSKLTDIEMTYTYKEWYKRVRASKESLKKQRKAKFEKSPKFSIIVPVFETKDEYLRELIESVLNQTYQNFQLCIADGSREGKDKEKLVKEYFDSGKIKYKLIGANLGISGNTNEALKLADGDFIVLCDHDDILSEDALYECAKVINENEDCDVIYSDEDKLDTRTKEFIDPHFKPDFNIDLLRSVNYITHLFVVKKDLVDKYGTFNSEFDGAQDYDFIFRMTENSKKIVHIAKILYHWRCHELSTAENPSSKDYAFVNGKKAIREHLKRTLKDIEVEDVEDGVDLGIYRVKYKVKDELISIIIPNKDNIKDLDKLVSSLYTKNTHKNIEVFIVENNSNEEETFKYYKDVEKKYPNLKVLYYEGGFNYSKINNYAVPFTRAKYLLFMNNDIEIIEKDSIKEMLSYVQREDVGICGARLLYNDDSIQHAGAVIGFSGIVGHTFIGLQKHERSYFNRAMISQNYSAVTAACMMSKREVFDKVGGFSEEFAVAFNDIDYCMKVRDLSKLVVYNPYALFYHYESKTRGKEDTKEKIERFNREIANFIKKWSGILEKGDPYYNPNLTLEKSDFSLKNLEREKIGKPYKIKGIEAYL